MVCEARLEQRARAHDVVGAGAHDAAEAVHDARAGHIPEQAVGVAEDVRGRVVVVELLRSSVHQGLMLTSVQGSKVAKEKIPC